MREIRLTQGKIALIDDEDFERVNKHIWHFNTRYAKTSIGGKITLMHVFIMGERGYDHRDRNGLNNQRANLRKATQKEQTRNRGIFKNKGYKGVERYRDRWFARITVDGKLIRLGGFSTEKEAAQAYDNAAERYYGDFASFNLR
jgi:hypothetical protein